jgi:hypothetical protein
MNPLCAKGISLGVSLVEFDYNDNEIQNAVVETPFLSSMGTHSGTRANDPFGSLTKTFTEYANDFSMAGAEQVLLASGIPSLLTRQDPSSHLCGV